MAASPRKARSSAGLSQKMSHRESDAANFTTLRSRCKENRLTLCRFEKQPGLDVYLKSLVHADSYLAASLKTIHPLCVVL